MDVILKWESLVQSFWYLSYKRKSGKTNNIGSLLRYLPNIGIAYVIITMQVVTTGFYTICILEFSNLKYTCYLERVIHFFVNTLNTYVHIFLCTFSYYIFSINNKFSESNLSFGYPFEYLRSKSKY